MTKLNLSKKIFLISFIGVLFSMFHFIWVNNELSIKLFVSFLLVSFLSIWYHSILIIKKRKNGLER